MTDVSPGGAWSTSAFRRATYALCAVVLALAAVLVVASIGYGLWRDTVPGPGLFPFAIGLVLAVLAVTVAVLTGSGRIVVDPELVLPDRSGAGRIAVILGACAAFTLLLEPLGFRVAMVLFVAGLLTLVSRVTLWKAAVAGVITGVVMHLLFVEALGVPLPDAGLGLLADLGL